VPLLDGLFGKTGSGPVLIPVAALVPVAFRIYYTPGYPPLLPDDLRARAASWAESHVEEPLRSALRPLFPTLALSYTDMAKTSFPPPLDVLQKSHVGEDERARFEKAWQVTVVACETVPQVPMFGLWVAVAAARSAALELNGALFDAPAVRLTPIASYEQGIPGNGALRVADHCAFTADTGPGGFIRWHTTGMSKFGLPEVAVLETAAGQDPEQLVQALAQHLLDTLLRTNRGLAQPVTELVLAPETTLPLPTGAAALKFHFTPGQAGVPTLVALAPD
jgi:hypothetical protein